MARTGRRTWDLRLLPETWIQGSKGLSAHASAREKEEPHLDLCGDGVPPRPFDLEDRYWLTPWLEKHPQKIVAYTFATLLTWSPINDYYWTFCGEETLFISCFPMDNDEEHFLQPLGVFGPEQQEILLTSMKQRNYPVKIFGVSDDFVRLHPEFVANFDVSNDPGQANYVYHTKALATLAGKIYAKKRNLIAQAHNLYAWTAEPITAENCADCLKVLARLDPPSGEDQSMQMKELLATRVTIKNFAHLKLKGVLIRVKGEPVAFSIYEAINPQTAAIHIEKADRNLKGLYQIINQETARAIDAEGYSFINREEDMGQEGLRQAKLSYAPSELIPSYTLTLKA